MEIKNTKENGEINMKNRKKNKKTQQIIGISISIIIIIILAACGKNEEVQKYFKQLTGIDISINTSNTSTNKKSENTSVEKDTENGTKTIIIGSGKDSEESLKVYFIDVGQADSILIINNSQSALIDAGNNEDGKNILQFIKDKGITKLDYIIGTHPHEDHIGGMDDIINNIDVENIYLPQIQTKTNTYEDVLKSIQNKNKTIKSLKKGDTFNVGNAKAEVMTDSILNKSNLNLSSNIIRMEYNNTSFLFTGDAETENENMREWNKTDILKVGHHGSKTSTSQKFLNQIKPTYAIISVGKDNDYGHPNTEILNRLNNIGAEIFRTDECGTIEIIVTKY